VLAVDRDRPAAGELGKIQAMSLALKADVEPVVAQTSPLEACPGEPTHRRRPGN
jgi:hypothetical protein